MLKDYSKQQLYFDITNKLQAESYKFLRLCGHKTTKYLTIIIHLFLQENGIKISDCTAEDIKILMEYLDSPLGKQNKKISKQDNALPDHDISEHDTENNDDIDDMRDALAEFS